MGRKLEKRKSVRKPGMRPAQSREEMEFVARIGVHSMALGKPLPSHAQAWKFWRKLEVARMDGWMLKILLVMAGGGLGSLSRYGVSLMAVWLFGSRFPFGTLIVNLAGCFLIGLSFALADQGFSIMNPSMRLFFMTGFLGGLTTFSTYALRPLIPCVREPISPRRQIFYQIMWLARPLFSWGCGLAD